MNTVNIKTDELLAAIIKNRNTHNAEYKEAAAEYRRAVVKELRKNADQAEKGEEIVRHSTLPVPSDHTEDYDRVIAMLKMSVDNVIELDSSDFDKFVLDNWSWKQSSSLTNSFYKMSASNA